MNVRSLFAFVCLLFAIGIVWMIVTIPAGQPSKSTVELFEPVAPVQKEAIALAEKTAPAGEKETTISKKEPSAAPKKEAPAEEKPKRRIAEAVSDEPPKTVAYTPAFGSVTFTHMRHFDDLGIDCGDCHHEDMEGGMSKCANCHEPPKRAIHKNCQGCHKKLEGEGKDSGPTRCRDCHTKKSTS